MEIIPTLKAIKARDWPLDRPMEEAGQAASQPGRQLNQPNRFSFRLSSAFSSGRPQSGVPLTWPTETPKAIRWTLQAH